MKVGSLCTGILGLDLAVEAHWGAELAWCAEIDPAASRVIAARRPGVPNLGDFRDVTPEPVDILCAGFPCQPVSSAGKRAGTGDERWLFDDICELVGRMGTPPGVLVFENVAGLLTANGGAAFRTVLGGLAALGFDARWGVVRASLAGAPQQRARWFCVATHPDRVGRDSGTGFREDGASKIGWGRLGNSGASDDDWPNQECGCCGGAISYDSECGDCGCSAWGRYEPAVRRWADVLGRDAPPPWKDGTGVLSSLFVEWVMGYPRGWVTGVDLAHTASLFGDIVPDREAEIRLLGNSVVPQQATLALRLLGSDTWPTCVRRGRRYMERTSVRGGAGGASPRRRSRTVGSLGGPSPEPDDVELGDAVGVGELLGLLDGVEGVGEAGGGRLGDGLEAGAGDVAGCGAEDVVAHTHIQPQTPVDVNHKLAGES